MLTYPLPRFLYVTRLLLWETCLKVTYIKVNHNQPLNTGVLCVSSTARKKNKLNNPHTTSSKVYEYMIDGVQFTQENNKHVCYCKEEKQNNLYSIA